jgi:hypothetical protein
MAGGFGDMQKMMKQLQKMQAVIDPNEPELLEDLVLAAVNEALRKAQDMVSAEMGKLTGGMKLPGVF